jgi:hypothetical protein
MEIHNHDPDHGEKNFKQYLFESLMVLLTVTLFCFTEGQQE